MSLRADASNGGRHTAPTAAKRRFSRGNMPNYPSCRTSQRCGQRDRRDPPSHSRTHSTAATPAACPATAAPTRGMSESCHPRAADGGWTRTGSPEVLAQLRQSPDGASGGWWSCPRSDLQPLRRWCHTRSDAATTNTCRRPTSVRRGKRRGLEEGRRRLAPTRGHDLEHWNTAKIGRGTHTLRL